jgi:hypothetical protein
LGVSLCFGVFAGCADLRAAELEEERHTIVDLSEAPGAKCCGESTVRGVRWGRGYGGRGVGEFAGVSIFAVGKGFGYLGLFLVIFDAEPDLSPDVGVIKIDQRR